LNLTHTKLLEFEARIRRAQADADLALAMPAGDSLPSQAGHAGEYLTTDGTDASWAAITASAIGSGELDMGGIADGGSGEFDFGTII
jgi:hypothetical protein